MTAPRVKRKLSAVLHADIKGYSRLMSENETETLRALTGHREVLFGMVQLHDGRVVDTAGDGFLLEFQSVVDAVAFAVEFQREITARNASVPPERRLEFRIGINVGDVIEDGDNIYGDGVNIAARLEALADPGGICLSGTAYDQLRRKLTLDYEFIGERSVKNIPEPVRAYRVLMGSPPMEAAPTTPPPEPTRGVPRIGLVAGAVLAAIVVAGIGYLYLGGRAPESVGPTVTEPKKAHSEIQTPCLVVLPFTPAKGDTDEQYLGEGLAAEISAAFTVIPEFSVIAPHSAVAFRTKPVDVKAVREKLGAGHILEGGLLREGDRVKIEAGLRDAATGSELWTKTYDLTDKEVFTVTRDIPAAVMEALKVGIPESARARFIQRKPPTESGEAYAKFLQGLACYHRGNKELHQRGREFFEQATSLDPTFAHAYALLARTYLREAGQGWVKLPAVALSQAFQLTEKALSLDPSLETAHLNMANLELRRREHDKALLQAQKALGLSPGDAETLAVVGMILVFAGRPEEALTPAVRAIRLNPITPSFYYQVLGDSHTGMKQYAEAIAAYNRGLVNRPDDSALKMRLVAAYSLAGKEKEAREAATDLIRTTPAFSLARLAAQMPYKNYVDGDRFVEALRKAGVK